MAKVGEREIERERFVVVDYHLAKLKQLLIRHAKNQEEKSKKEIRLFKTFLKDSTKKRRMDYKLRKVVRHIRDVVIRAAKVESWNYLVSFFHLSTRLLSIRKKVKSVCRRIKNVYGDKSRADFAILHVEDGVPEETKAPILRKENVVGLEDEAEKLKGYLNQETKQLVFGKPEFPFELEVMGKLIAKKCGGLPLAIVVRGGILVKKYSASGELNARQNAWRKASASISTSLNDDAERRMEKIISLSYEKLPYHLRECFLYMGIFPEDFEIPAWKLILLWIAEGFIQQKDGISLEETAENYLDDLITRNLVRADKFKANGKVKTCRIHNMLRDFCIAEAGNEREKFFQEIKKSSDRGFQPPLSEEHKYRRLCIHSNVLNFLSEKPCCPTVRSFVCFSKDIIPIRPNYISAIPAGFKLLRVLDVKPLIFTILPSDMYQLLHLRYIALSVYSMVLPAAFSKLWNLQTLIVDTTSRILLIKVDILNMIQLRHFKTNASATLPKTDKSSKGGERIQTLGTISPESCTEEVFGSARNLKKLGIRGRLALLLEDKNGSFDSLGKLGNLENLKLINDLILCSTSECQLRGLPPAYKFPAQLRSLTLCGTSLDWTHMSILESLDKLKVLKLKHKAFWGKSWVATDGGFRHLEVLLIGCTNLENWVASHHHFPRLKCLELRNCENLKEIPIGLADIPNF